MFDLVDGLPVHVLVVHAVVVLLPLMSLVTIAFVVRPRWRAGLPWAVLGNLVALGAAYVASQSGQRLQDRLSAQVGREVAAEHSDLGAVLPWFALGLLAASVVAYLLVGRRSRTADGTTPSRSSAAVAGALALVLVAAGAASFWTYRVGDSGSRAVWEDTIANTDPPPGG